MSENKFSDNELEEPEGFWPEGSWHDQEPPENEPFSPDPLELTPAPQPADEPSVTEPADAYDPYDAYEHVASSDQTTQAEEPTHTSPFEERVYDATAPEVDDPWQISDINEDTADEMASVDETQHTSPFAADQYAYHTTEEPVRPEPPREFDDSRSWQDEVHQPAGENFLRSDAATASQRPWEAGPQPPVDPFTGDPFSPTATEDYWVGQPAYSDPNAPSNYIPETPEETIRRSGLAWSAGIAFFGSVAFMLFLGWIADLLLGTSPWAMVGGIVLGSIIGFIQFFRISSQIYGPNKQTADFRPLLTQTDDEIVNEHVEPPATPPVI